MELRQLRYFVGLAEEPHFLRAAGVRLVMTGGPTAEQVGRLTAGENDLALLRGTVTLPSGFRQASVAREEPGVLMSQDHPFTAADGDVRRRLARGDP